MKPATAAVALGRPGRSPDAPLNHPVHFASALAAGGDVGYTREDQVNSAAFEQVLGALEGGHAVLFSSGMAAVAAVLDTLRPAEVHLPPVLYAGTRLALDERAGSGALRLRELRVEGDWSTGSPGDLTWLEAPTNPDLRVPDIASIAAQSPGPVLVDNTFATPLGQTPLACGADIVLHSVSKYLGGHSDLILGALVTADADLAESFRRHRTVAGAIPGPMEAWLALRGVRTLDVRYRRAGRNAAILAERLSQDTRVSEVIWPWLADHPDHEVALRQFHLPCPVVSFRPRAGVPGADRVCSQVTVWTHATSLGGVESTLERRHEHEFESPQVPQDLIRASVGIEDPDDLWADLSQALEAGS